MNTDIIAYKLLLIMEFIGIYMVKFSILHVRADLPNDKKLKNTKLQTLIL